MKRPTTRKPVDNSSDEPGNTTVTQPLHFLHLFACFRRVEPK